MRTWVILLLLTGASCLLRAQQEPDRRWTKPGPVQDGGVREVLESIVIPPIPNSPFEATLDTEWVRYAPDGATITFVNERHIARDRRGRIYEERWALVPKFHSNGPHSLKNDMDSDCRSQTSYALQLQHRSARL